MKISGVWEENKGRGDVRLLWVTADPTTPCQRIPKSGPRGTALSVFLWSGTGKPVVGMELLYKIDVILLA